MHYGWRAGPAGWKRKTDPSILLASLSLLNHHQCKQNNLGFIGVPARCLYKECSPGLVFVYLLFAYWLRSSVVSVLSSLITGSLALPSILLLSFFLACVESPLACYVVRHRWLWHYTTAKCCRLLKFQRS